MGSFEEALTRGTAWAFVTVFGAGVATSLTPCVYPMIPITVSIFGAREARSRRSAFLLATCYVMGIALMYAGLGVLAAVGGWAAGSLLASPWFVVPLSALFLVLATSMFGLWELHVPHWISSRVSMVGGRGYRGAFLMGLVGGILIAPCTGPVLAGLLAYVATTGDMLLGGGLLFTYAMGIGVLFWVIATFAVSLPKGGRWLRAISSLFGVALVVAALYYLQNVLAPLALYSSGSRAFALANAALVVAGIAIGALHIEYHGATAGRALRKTLGILLVCCGIFGIVNFATTPRGDLPWLHDEQVALQRAANHHRPVFVDFWATWCAPCKLMEAQVLTHPAVRRSLDRFVLLKIDVTRDSERDRVLKRKYNAAQLPQIVLLDHAGAEQARAGEVLDPQAMLTLLRRAR